MSNFLLGYDAGMKLESDQQHGNAFIAAGVVIGCIGVVLFVLAMMFGDTRNADIMVSMLLGGIVLAGLGMLKRRGSFSEHER